MEDLKLYKIKRNNVTKLNEKPKKIDTKNFLNLYLRLFLQIEWKNISMKSIVTKAQVEVYAQK